MVKLARRSELFPFLSRCTPDARIVLGDARLTIQKDTARYDAIVLDAFSSDAVPAHLLTSEAFAIYASRLKPGGVIIAHVSNRYMDLASVAAAAGMAEGMAALKAHVRSIRAVSRRRWRRLSRRRSSSSRLTPVALGPPLGRRLGEAVAGSPLRALDGRLRQHRRSHVAVLARRGPLKKAHTRRATQ